MNESEVDQEDDWLSLSQGSRNLGFNRNYLQERIKINNLETVMIERGMLLKLGHAKFINSKGIDFVKKHVKKLGAHANQDK